ncbi:hypothetical protein THAOC_08422 [Thalassiosira oceanica]|uniref:Uncharacterized protein n=1 Tax=Thalassiosira oceanica TaxID=159749 RepID=K0SZ37_THAOC|nr:hypothetical protein THAOC_08422 [Thalassiosira oceanica]|eukprot:EJK70234.1 hypothetical protein THAOC_08422 [Thalassiosira oceanica]
MEVTPIRGSEDVSCGCGVGEGTVVLSDTASDRPHQECSPPKEERGPAETARVKTKPARHRRKSVSERMPGALRASSSDLTASFASAETASDAGMVCDSPGEDSSIKTGGAMSPVEAARLVSAEFSREGRRGCSPNKKEAKPARQRRKSVSERIPGALRASSSDLTASFASAETASDSGMGCDSPGELFVETVGAMSPVDGWHG